MPEEKLLTLKEVVTYLKIPSSTIYKLSQRGELPSVKIGKQLRFRKASLDEWLAKNEGQSACSLQSVILPDHTAAAIKTKSKNVLLIDDDELVLKTLSKFLKIYGYKVNSVKDGESALKEIENSVFNLVIADVRMPGMDGLETVKRIRQMNNDKKKSHIPEIIITGYMDSAAQQEAQRMGVADYIHKPFFISELLSVVKEKIHVD